MLENWVECKDSGIAEAGAMIPGARG